MKKITALSIALLLIATVVFTMSSCDKDKNNSDGKYDFSADVKSYELDIYNGTELFQTLEYPSDRKAEIDIDYAEKHIELLDLNFDGLSDVCLAVKKEGSVISYFCWIFNGNTEKFEYSDELSALTTISLDADKKQIISSVADENGNTHYVFYTWENGTLKKSEELKSDDDRVSEEVSEVVKNNTVGEKENTVKPPKNVNTTKNNTTTSPSNSADTTQGSSQNNIPESTKGNSSSQGTPESTTATSGNNSSSKEDGVQIATGDFDDGWF